MSLTPLEQFNEEVMKAIDYNSHDMGEMGKFIRVEYAKNIITQKLTEHKALILKMVREKAEDSNGYGEFLDDLKTF